MLRCGNRIRLTSREVERLIEVTGFDPGEITTLEELHDYVERCKDYYCGASWEARYLHWLIDEERYRCLVGI
jgi:hypothetical protein